jgi:thiol-disulfide isomerase/thioredoxin
VLSAEEATREVVQALAAKDFAILEPVLIRPNDAAALAGLVTPDQIRELNATVKERFDSLCAKLSHLTGESRWMRFDGGIPHLIPGDAADGSRDVQSYRNASVLVQTGNQIDVLQFREMILLGKTWKILDTPTAVPLGESPVAGINTVFANVPGDQAGVVGVDPKFQALVVELQKLDEGAAKSPQAGTAAARYHLQRADILQKLAEATETGMDRSEWYRQMADSLIAALQVEDSREARDRLGRLSERLADNNDLAQLVPYILFRKISADYSRTMQAPGADFAAVQKDWLEQLEQFVTDHPDAEDTPEALVQLAVGMEFSGKEEQARTFYERIGKEFPKSTAATRAAGSLRRLDLVGKTFSLKGSELRRGTVDVQSYRGKVYLVDYWATWCEPCKAEFPQLKQIYEKYRSKGFEVLGISLDNDKAEVAKFVKNAGLPWAVLFEEGGLDSPLAGQYGVISLPTRFLVDAQGKVVSRTIQISQLEEELKKLLK